MAGPCPRSRRHCGKGGSCGRSGRARCPRSRTATCPGWRRRPTSRPPWSPVPPSSSAPGRAPAGGSGDWLASSGKTQVAAGLAESLWQSGKLDLLIWVDATSRASVLSGYVAAAVAASSTDPAGDAETVATRLVNWLAKTSRPWLLVLDDLSDPADLEGLWPRRAGREGPGHDRGCHSAVPGPPGTGLSGGGLQPPRGAELPDRPADRGHRPAPRRHRPRRRTWAASRWRSPRPAR